MMSIEDKKAAAQEYLLGDHPWLPGVVFAQMPGLAEHLAKAVATYSPPVEGGRTLIEAMQDNAAATMTTLAEKLQERKW